MTDSHNTTTGLTRSVDEKVFGGVCGGLGEQFGIDAWWFRWAFIILTLFGFAGAFFYILAWILIPKETDDESVAVSWMEGLDLTDVGTIFGVVLIGVAAVSILNQFFSVSGGLVAAGVLAVVGVLMYRGDLRPPDWPKDNTKDNTEHYLDEDEAAATDVSIEGVEADTTVAQKPPSPPKPPKPAKPRKPKPPKSMLGRLTMAVVLIVLSTMAMVELSDWYHFQPVDYAGAAMATIALGLIIGSWVGRARWLIVIGILMAPWLLLSAFLPTISEWSAGEHVYTPLSIEEVLPVYDLGAGQMTVDLTHLTQQELAEIGTIRAEVGLGQLVVRLPAGVGATVDAEIGIGALTSERVVGSSVWRLDDHHLKASGVDVDRSFEMGLPPYSLHLDLEVGLGEISVRAVNDTTSEG